ncbi:GMC family oxidoreductase [Sphingobium yanoikuyae]|uniref:GMC family oxidoreductase n=1 Tax=Sphingobium yanoikuyae TaxID=13690 RepID=UPI0028A69FF6|nr:GMC family oxidoreductase [Sphingobium yanoikuyae]
MAVTERYDVCIIGGGLTGLMTAKAALAQGKSVVIVERGGEYLPDELDRRTWWKESVRSEQMDDNYRHYQNKFDGDQHFDDLVQNESGNPPWSFKYNMWYGIGGASQMWSGMAWRLAPEDFSTQTDYGYGFDWPISYEDIAPYYDRAERFLEVSGPAADIRKDYKYWPWENDYVYPHFPLSYLDNKFQDVIGDLAELVPQPHAVRNKPVEEGGCVGAKTCVSYCASKAIFKGNERILPDIIFDDNLTILFKTAVTRLDWNNETGLINYVVGQTEGEDEPRHIEAETFFLCGNAFENIRLIQYSEQQNQTPFGQSSPLVGRYFSSHAAVTYTVVMKEDVFPVRGRPTHASVIEWVKREPQAKIGGITLEIWDNDFTMGYGPWRHFDTHVSKGHWGGHLFNLLQSFERRFCISMIFETEMTESKRFTLSPTNKDKFGIPVGRIDLGLSELDEETLRRTEGLAHAIGERPGIASFAENGRGINGNHPLGGLRMSESAETGVLNDRCRSHDFKNLYVLGGSAFCSTGSFNPTLTIAALAMRAYEDPELGWTNAAY